MGCGEEVLAQLGASRAGRTLLEVAARRPGAHLVGGAVRDLLLGRAPGELDVAVEGDVGELVEDLVGAGGTKTVLHDRFATATVLLAGTRIDLARTRSERYPHPGALPVVRPAGIVEDARRRDFTINAMAVALGGDRVGAVHAPPDAAADLAARRLRVMHDASFLDDPTRLLRLARYAARLGFSIEAQTEQLAGDALTAGAVGTVSGARLGAELRHALLEPDPLAALDVLQRLGVLVALHPGLVAPGDVGRRALSLLPAGGCPGLVVLAAAWSERGIEGLGRWLDRMEFPGRERDVVLDAVARADRLGAELERALRPSQVGEYLRFRPLETVALAGALGGPGAAAAARRWLDEWRQVALEITGQDLMAAGVPAGPEVGRRLRSALARKLDGEIPAGRSAELAAALEGP